MKTTETTLAAAAVAAGEGVPSSIFPDHEGRADYHGPAVNMAARYTDKGAKGGQIACSLDLAQKVLAVWASSSSSSLQVLSSRDGSLQGGVAAAAGGSSTEGCCSPGSLAGRRSGTGDSDSRPTAGDGVQSLQLELRTMSAVQQPVAAAAAAAAASGFGSRPGSLNGNSSMQLLHVGAPLLSISSGIEMTDVQQAQLELQREAQQQQHGSHKQAGVDAHQGPQQQQQQELVTPLPSSPPSGSVSAAGAAALPSSRNTSFVKGYGGSGHSLWLQQKQQQQLNRLLPLRIGQPASGTSAAAAAGAAGGGEVGVGPQQATFAVPNPPRAPVQVEVHRLGLFAFKGGPPQQEMVQIVPTHLLGRLDITARSAVAPSRKGQQLQKLEGRICEPVTVHLPTLAQEYKTQLPERLLASPARFPLSRGRAYAVTDRRGGGGILHASDDGFSLPATNSAPVEGSEQRQHQQQQQQHVRWDSSVEAASRSADWAAAATAGAAAGRCHSSSGKGSTAGRQAPRPLANLRVMSDTTSQTLHFSSQSDSGAKSVSGASTVAATASGSAQLPSLRAGGWHASCDERGPGAAAPAAAAVGLASRASKNSSKASGDCGGHLTLSVNSSASASDENLASILCSSSHDQPEPLMHEIAAAPAASAAVAADNRGSMQRSGLSSSSCSVTRHDSFRSVASADAGESATAAAADDACPDLAACRSSKSGSSETQAQQLVPAGGDLVLQPELHAQLLQQQSSSRNS
jgi:hypothetical protein